MIKYFSKLIAAILGGLTPTGVIAFLAENGVEVPAEVAALIVTAAAAVVTGLAPANGEHPSKIYEDQELISPETHPELYELETVNEYVGKHRAPCEECPASGCKGCPVA